VQTGKPLMEVEGIDNKYPSDNFLDQNEYVCPTRRII
jgi:hypothetical protein